MTDMLVGIALYSYALLITLRGAFKWKIDSDWQREYDAFLTVMKGEWRLLEVKYGSVGTCLLFLMVPYLVWRLTKWNPLVLFKIMPCFFYSMVPVFTYLIAREWFSPVYAAMGSFYILSTFFFAYYPNMGRNCYAISFLAGMGWAILNGNILLGSLFAVLLVVSHYGTAYYTLVLLITASALSVVMVGGSIPLVAILMSLVVTIAIWSKIVHKRMGESCTSIAASTFSTKSLELGKPMYIVSPQGKIIGVKDRPVDTRPLIAKLLDTNYRDPIVQVAFGRTWRYSNKPQKLEFVLSWLNVIFLTSGVILGTIWWWGSLYLSLALPAFGLIVFSVLSPTISFKYGTARTYLTSMMLLTPFFILGVINLAAMLRVNGAVFGFVIIGLYALCVSGKLHSWAGIDKRLSLAHTDEVEVPKPTGA